MEEIKPFRVAGTGARLLSPVSTSGRRVNVVVVAVVVNQCCARAFKKRFREKISYKYSKGIEITPRKKKIIKNYRLLKKKRSCSFCRFSREINPLINIRAAHIAVRSRRR